MSPSHRTRALTCACATAIGLVVAAAPALGDGGRTAWPGSSLLAGDWSATARSTTAPDLTFPVRATISVASTGRPTGTVDLGSPIDCTGRWSPVSVSGRITTFSESITSKLPGGECIDGGNVRLSPASGGRLRYSWAKGGGGSVAYLDPVGISGAWTGRLSTGTPASVHLRIVGVSGGEMQGTVRFGAPLGCRGVIIPQGNGSQKRAVAVERITSNPTGACVDLGTDTFTLRADGRLAYRWQSGGDISTAILSRAG